MNIQQRLTQGIMSHPNHPPPIPGQNMGQVQTPATSRPSIATIGMMQHKLSNIADANRKNAQVEEETLKIQNNSDEKQKDMVDNEVKDENDNDITHPSPNQNSPGLPPPSPAGNSPGLPPSPSQGNGSQGMPPPSPGLNSQNSHSPPHSPGLP
jgi:hypothetical protein